MQMLVITFVFRLVHVHGVHADADGDL